MFWVGYTLNKTKTFMWCEICRRYNERVVADNGSNPSQARHNPRQCEVVQRLKARAGNNRLYVWCKSIPALSFN